MMAWLRRRREAKRQTIRFMSYANARYAAWQIINTATDLTLAQDLNADIGSINFRLTLAARLASYLHGKGFVG